MISPKQSKIMLQAASEHHSVIKLLFRLAGMPPFKLKYDGRFDAGSRCSRRCMRKILENWWFCMKISVEEYFTSFLVAGKWFHAGGFLLGVIWLLPPGLAIGNPWIISGEVRLCSHGLPCVCRRGDVSTSRSTQPDWFLKNFRKKKNLLHIYCYLFWGFFWGHWGNTQITSRFTVGTSTQLNKVLHAHTSIPDCHSSFPESCLFRFLRTELTSHTCNYNEL